MKQSISFTEKTAIPGITIHLLLNHVLGGWRQYDAKWNTKMTTIIPNSLGMLIDGKKRPPKERLFRHSQSWSSFPPFEVTAGTSPWTRRGYVPAEQHLVPLPPQTAIQNLYKKNTRGILEKVRMKKNCSSGGGNGWHTNTLHPVPSILMMREQNKVLPNWQRDLDFIRSLDKQSQLEDMVSR